MQIPLAYLDTTAIEEISVDLWRSAFDMLGWPPSLAQAEPLTHADVLRALETDSPSDELLLLLEVLHTLGSETGREAIQRAMLAAGAPANALPADVGEREFAFHLFLAQRGDALLADVFARAQLEFDVHGSARRYSEFVAREIRPMRDHRQCGARVEEVMRAYCRDHDLGDHVQVRTVADDRTYLFHVIHSHHVRKPLAVLPGTSGRAMFAFRPVHGDLLRYDAATGRLRVAARAPSLVDHYRQLAGDVLFDDPTFFSSDAVCSLRVLQEKGRLALDEHEVAGVGRVRMTECVWEQGGDLVHFRSADCFLKLERLGLPLQEGMLIEAKLKIQVAEKSTRPATVTIRVPSRIEIRPKRHEQLVDAYLDAIGIRVVDPPTLVAGLWDLWSAPQAEGTWRLIFGAATDPMVRAQVLRPVRLDSLAHPAHAGAGRVLDGHPLESGDAHGVSRIEEIPSRRLSATDLDALQLDLEAMRGYLRRQFGAVGSTAPGSPGDPLDLGTIELASLQFRLFYAIARPRVGVGQQLRQQAQGATPVLLVPGDPSVAAEVTEVALVTALPSRTSVVRAMINACNCRDRVPAVHFAPEGVRLVVDEVAGLIWFDGTEVTGLKADTHPFKFVAEVARAFPGTLDSGQLSDLLSIARLDGSSAARKAKMHARRLIQAAVTAAGGATPDDPFPSRSGTYRCGVTAYVHDGRASRRRR